MREILFKAKRADNGEWVEGDLVRHYENQRRFIACDQMAYTSETVGIKRLVSENSHEVIPETVCQYTGLKDKNGDKIFEGDIVNIIADDEQGIIEWDKDEAHFTVNVDNCCSTFTNHYGTDLEIIGNIHDKE